MTKREAEISAEVGFVVLGLAELDFLVKTRGKMKPATPKITKLWGEAIALEKELHALISAPSKRAKPRRSK